ncbi:hypothetical protein FQN49_006957 [Arthroderma sp. PD_2]|nr:hypothetical protein FQN49_006957 [Arthroderma sp. PD_2]
MGDFVEEAVSLHADPLPNPIPQDDDIHVVVTGFGVSPSITINQLHHSYSKDETDRQQPFKTNPLNPSFLITSLLPQYLPATAKDQRRIRIHAHPLPIRVAYPSVRSDVPAIIEAFRAAHDGRPPHLVVHVGMASTRQYYAVETIAHRDGYRVTDVDGQLGVPFDPTLPESLQPGMPCKTAAAITPAGGSIKINPSPPDTTFLQTWRKSLPPGRSIDVRLSHDAGRYLCEYIYYTSLSMAWEEQRPRGVVFLHVPGWTDRASVEMGADALVGLVRAMVECWVVDNTDI